MKNLIITGTRSLSIADRAVAATMAGNVTIVTASDEQELPNGITQAFVGNTAADVKAFQEKLKEIKDKWAVRYKTLVGMSTNEKREDYRVMVIGWAQENGAPNFCLDAPKTKAAKPAKAKKTGAQANTKVVKAKEPITAPLDLEDEFGEETDHVTPPAPAEESTTEELPFEVEPEAETVAPEPEAETAPEVEEDNEFED